MYQQALIFSREQVISWEWDQGSGNHGNSLLWRKGREKIKGQNTKSSRFGQLVNNTLNDKVPIEKGDKN